MAQLDEMLSSLLADPKNMQLLSSLLGGEETPKQETVPTLPAGLDAAQLGGMLQKLGGPPDDRCKLLMALRPFVDGPKQQRIDQGVQLLKLMGLAESMGGLGLV